MSTVAIASTCVCGSIGAASEIRFCSAGHHRYWFGDKQLTSVSSVIRSTWPLKPDFSAADPAVLDHARERGIRVDSYFQQYVSSGRIRVPAGEWTDVIELTRLLVNWWDRQTFSTATWITQKMVHDGDIAGAMDLYSPELNLVLDLKTVSRLEPVYGLQVAAYDGIGQLKADIGAIHLNKRGVHLVTYGKQEREDWLALRRMWDVVRRRAPKKTEEL